MNRSTTIAMSPNVCASLIAVVLAGCATGPSKPQTPATTTLQYELPTVSPVDATKVDQEKDGIRVSVVPYQFNAKTVVEREYREVPALFAVSHRFPGEAREIPHIQIEPGSVRLKVKISNRLERVLRLAGTVVSFQVAGKTENVASSNYQEFLNGIILPRQQAEFDLGGPALAVLKDKTTMGLLLYDIVTATDPAGNATQRSNFEWFFTVGMESKTQQVPLVTKKIYLNEADLQVIRSKGITAGQWGKVPEFDAIMNRLGQ